MRFRRLRLALQTTDGPYGTTLDFPDGLVVIWADNSMGKSTCARAILVALGMEAMLTTSQQDLPVPPAMKLRLDSGGGSHTVLESDIYLEIENSSGRRIVVQRTVKGERNKNLITVHNGPALTAPQSSYASSDYFVNRGGAAVRDSGFHHFLANFLGWNLPIVQTFDGNEVPLYLQCILPYFIVEQTRGWSTAPPPIPTQFRIRDAHKRAVEFLLNMDAHRIALQRQSLRFQKGQLEGRWSSLLQRANEIADGVAGTTQALPRQPVASWPPEITPSISVPVEDKWISLAQRVATNRERLKVLVDQEIPRVEEIASATQTQLVEAEQLVQTKQTLLSRMMEALEAEELEVSRVKQRIDAINEDIQRNKDVRTLRELGSRQHSVLDHGTCPVCHQAVHDSLVPLPNEQGVMTLDENIEFLTEQRRTFAAVLGNSERIAEARRQQTRALRDELVRARENVRYLRQTLMSDGRAPSLAAVYARIELESLIKRDEEASSRFFDVLDQFGEVALSWRDMQADLLKLPKDDISDADRRKINRWSELLRDQLAEYGFKSFNPSQASISNDVYRPEHEGFDLQTSISASDLIRTIWAYLGGMLELARENETSHPGTLIFDEPRQQSTRDVSFAALLVRAAKSVQSHQQVIFFTSEDQSRLQSHLRGLKHTFRSIEGRVLKPLRESRS